MKKLLVTGFLLFVMLNAQIAAACPVCYGNPSSPLTKAADKGIFFLLGIVAFVQLGFIALFVTFWRRSRALQRRRESFRLIDGGVHSVSRELRAGS